MKTTFQTAFQIQSEIFEKHKQDNAEAHKSYQESISAGHITTCIGAIEGPYTTHTTYFTSDGKTHSFVGLASLAWAYKNSIIMPY